MVASLFGSTLLVCCGLLVSATAVLWYTSITVDRGVLLGVSLISGPILQSLGAYGLFYETGDGTDSERASEQQAVARRLAQGMDMPTPTVTVRYGDRPNAESMVLPGVDHRIVLTSALVETLSREQVACVIAHELAHVKNSDAAVMPVAAVPAVAFGTLATFGSYVRRRGKWWFLTPAGLAVAALQVIGVVGWVPARVCVGTLSRYREFAADRAAVRVTGQPATYATTLREVGGGPSPPSDDLR